MLLEKKEKKAIVFLLVSVTLLSAFAAMSSASYPVYGNEILNLDTGLIARWNMDEGSGNVTGDTSPHGFDGIATGCTWIWGVRGHGLHFSDSSARVNVSDVANYIKTNSVKSIAHVVWMKVSSTGNWQITGEIAEHIHSEIQMEYGGKVHFWMEDPSDADYMVYSNGSLADGRWHFVVGQYNYTSKVMELWVDGSLQERKTYDFEPNTNISDFFIGQGDSGGFPNGEVDDVRIYERTLSPEEIQTLYRERLSAVRINSDADLESFASSHNLPGDGSSSSPYVMSEFSVDAQGAKAGIFIGNVSLHLVIRDVSVENTSSGSSEYGYGDGIEIYRSSNTTVKRIQFENIAASPIRVMESSGIEIRYLDIQGFNRDNLVVYGSEDVTIRFVSLSLPSYTIAKGVYVSHSTYVSIVMADITNFSKGIYCEYSKNSGIMDNTLRYGGDAIAVVYSDGSSVKGNEIIGGVNGIEAYSSQLNISNNRIIGTNNLGIYVSNESNYVGNNKIIESSYYGIYIENARNNTIRGNFILNTTHYGIYIDSSASGNLLYENTLKFNNGTVANYTPGIVQAYDSGSNTWYFNHTGNYWLDWARNNESNDRDGDGIIDYPYHLSGGGVDPYPLIDQRHEPIVIVGDTQMEEFARDEGIPGNGTQGNPYVIDHYLIDARGAGNAIYIENVNYTVVVRNNTLWNARFYDFEHRGGDGVRFYNMHSGTIENNIIYSCFYGISLRYSSNISVLNNTIYDVGDYALNIYRALNGTIQGNSMSERSILLLGDFDTFTMQVIDESNTVNGKAVKYIHNYAGSGEVLTGDYGEIILANASHITLDSVVIRNGSMGVLAGYSNNVTMRNCTFTGHKYGIRLMAVQNFTIDGCNISNNADDGITMQSESSTVYSRDNVIKNSVFIGNRNDGGVNVYKYARNVTVENSTFIRNNRGLILDMASQIVVQNNVMRGNIESGLYITDYSSNILVENNTCAENYDGITIKDHANSVVVRGNFLYQNQEYGVKMLYAQNNLIYNNSFYYNRGSNDSYLYAHSQAHEYGGGNNRWNTTQYGNFWADWRSTDPYVFEGNRDYHPYATPLHPAVPLSPRNLVQVNGSGFVNLSWVAPRGMGSGPITAYRIYRNGTFLVEVPASQLYYNDTSVVDGFTYTYYVTAVNSAGESERSNEVSATPQTEIPEFSTLLLAIFMLGIALVMRGVKL